MHLTPTGAELAIRLEALLHDVRRDILANVSEADLKACLRVFRAIEGPNETVTQHSSGAAE